MHVPKSNPRHIAYVLVSGYFAALNILSEDNEKRSWEHARWAKGTRHEIIWWHIGGKLQRATGCGDWTRTQGERGEGSRFAISFQTVLAWGAKAWSTPESWGPFSCLTMQETPGAIKHTRENFLNCLCDAVKKLATRVPPLAQMVWTHDVFVSTGVNVEQMHELQPYDWFKSLYSRVMLPLK